MKKQFRLVTVLAALIVITSGLPVLTARAEEEGIPICAEAPMFSADIKYSFEGYVVKGTFTEFMPDISHIQPIYSLDGEVWQACGVEWDLQRLGTEEPDELANLQNQICLYDSFEPLKSYLEGSLDYFYLKLRLTRENGITYETQAAIIDRGASQPVCDEMTFMAAFDSSMSIFERNPFCYYGRYQLTVSADATSEDISALLPNTLPVEVQLQKDGYLVAKGIVDCPVAWKPLSLPQLTAGECVTIPDAAEELVVPAGTLVSTPIGVFQLEEPLKIDQDEIITDEVRLVLNVISEGEKPAETLTSENSWGAGGNEGNAGADNKKDSTEEGQRSGLPQNTENQPEEQYSNPPLNSENQPEGQQSDLYQNLENQSEMPPHSDTSLNMEPDDESRQSQQDMTPADRFADSIRSLTAAAVADVRIFVVAVKMRANYYLNNLWKFYNKFSTFTQSGPNANRAAKFSHNAVYNV